MLVYLTLIRFMSEPNISTNNSIILYIEHSTPLPLFRFVFVQYNHVKHCTIRRQNDKMSHN